MSVRATFGFTLIEVLMVIILLGIIGMVILPDFEGAERTTRLDESIRRLRALAAMCRAEAMNQSREFQIDFRRDGSVRVRVQLDPILAARDFVPVKDPWARTPFVLEDVWVEAVLPLPEGPPPILIEDDEIEFELAEDDAEDLYEPQLWEELDVDEVSVRFRPDGTGDSLKWVLRHRNGRGAGLTLDGRLGRVASFDVEPLDEDSVQRPEPFDEGELEQEQDLFEQMIDDYETEKDRIAESAGGAA